MEIEELTYELFVNRKDAYAEQFLQTSGKKGFKCVKDVITLEHSKKHIKAVDNYSIGVYQLDLDNSIKWGCYDFDKNTHQDFEEVKILYKYLKKNGFNPLLEKSGGGEYKVHIWIFSKGKISATYMKTFLEDISKKAKVTPHEIFPKQTEIEKDGFGNLVKLPLGIHLSTKKFSCLLDDDFKEITDSEKLYNTLKYHYECVNLNIFHIF